MSTPHNYAAILDAIKAKSFEAFKKEIVNIPDISGFIPDHKFTLLFAAASYGFEECVRYLLEKGADPNITANQLGPIHLAAKNGFTSIISLLCEKNADVTLIDNTGSSPLASALKQGGKEAAIKLVSFKAPLVESIPNDSCLSTPLASCGLVFPSLFDSAPSVPLSDIPSTYSCYIDSVASLASESSKTDSKITFSGGEIPCNGFLLSARCHCPEASVSSPHCNSKQAAEWFRDWVHGTKTGLVPPEDDSIIPDLLSLVIDVFSKSSSSCKGHGDTPIPLILSKSKSPAALFAHVWNQLWESKESVSPVINDLRAESIRIAASKDNKNEDIQKLLTLLKDTDKNLIPAPFETLLSVGKKEEEMKEEKKKEDKLMEPEEDDLSDRDYSFFSPVCPQDIKDLIKETDIKLGRDLLYATVEPTHVSICTKIFSKLKKKPDAVWFQIPVDEARDGAPNYYQVIKRPMDLTTLNSKYLHNAGSSGSGPQYRLCDFLDDFRLIWQNAFTFNCQGSVVCTAADALAKLLEQSICDASWPGYDKKAQPGVKRERPEGGLSRDDAKSLYKKLARLEQTKNVDALREVVRITKAEMSNGQYDIDLAKLPGDVLRELSQLVSKY